MPKFIRHIWPLNIRIQMMLWYTLVFTILMILAGTLFYLHLQTSLVSNVDTELQQNTQEIAAGIKDEHGSVTVNDTDGVLPGLTDPDATQDTSVSNNGLGPQEIHADINLGPLVRILNGKGESVYTSPAFRDLQAPSISINQPLYGSSWQGTIPAKNGQTVRLSSTPLIHNGSVYAIVQVGESLANLGNTLRSVGLELLFIGPFVLIFGFIVSYWLAGYAFAPIKKLTGTARRIEAGDLHERVPVPRANDELQTLALTFNEMIERLEKAFARQRRFVIDASHELRTPVAAIRSMTDVTLARSTPVEPEVYQGILRDVNTEAERLGHLISDLLILARTDENKIALEREPIHLDLLTVDVAATMELLAAEKNITQELHINKPAPVIGDEVRLIQVLMNLIDNAINYTNSGGRVIVSVDVRDKSVWLTVSDTGIGIAEEHLEHIFERFYRVDPARSRAADSTGLGLSIVDWIVRAHGGTISVESQVRQGTTFTVKLPLAE